MAKQRKSYTPKFKFQVVLETLKGDRSSGEIARAFGIHPVMLSQWKAQFLDKGPEVFSGTDAVRAYAQRIAELERMVGQKEVELALLKNFLIGR
jgi:transposase-like protein